MFSRLLQTSLRCGISSSKNVSVIQEQKRGFRRLASTTASNSSPSALPGINISIQPGVNITPKRGPNAYNLFTHEKFKELKGNSPEITVPNAAKLIGSQWQKLNADEKRKYEMESIRIQKEYENAFFSMSMGEFREAVMKEMKQLQKQRVTELRRQKKQLKETYQYPQADTDFFKLQAVATDHPAEMAAVGKTPTVRAAKMMELWGAMSDEEKNKYEKREKAARSKYMKDIEAWESQMRKKGLANVVDMIKLRPHKETSYRLRGKKKILASKVSISKRTTATRRKKSKATKEE